MPKNGIINLRELVQMRQGCSYRGDVAVFGLDPNPAPMSGLLEQGVYVNAFSYILVTSGLATFKVDGVDYEIKQNALCIFSPLHLTWLHDVSQDFRCLILGVTRQFIDGLLVENIHNRIIRGMSMYHLPIAWLTDDEAAIVGECICDVSRQLQRSEHRYQLEMIRNALNRFNIETDNILFRYNDFSVAATVTVSRQRLILQQFIGLLLENYRVKHDVPFYARKMNLSPQYLTSIIKQQAGRTVSDFIEEMLYSEARNLLAMPEYSIQQIAEELGYADQASFSKAFKRLSGTNPQRFRYKLVESLRLKNQA